MGRLVACSRGAGQYRNAALRREWFLSQCWKYLARDNQLALHEIFVII